MFHEHLANSHCMLQLAVLHDGEDLADFGGHLR